MFHQLVVRYCRGRLGPGEAAEMAAEEIDDRVAWLLPSRDDGARFLVRAYRIAREVTDAHAGAAPAAAPGPSRVAVRPRRRLRAVPDLPAETAPPAAAAMTALIRMLPADLREVLVLRVAAGLAVEDVAALVELSPEAVRVKQHRALARLRALGEGPSAAQA